MDIRQGKIQMTNGAPGKTPNALMTVKTAITVASNPVYRDTHTQYVGTGLSVGLFI
jgi:hypothetical protein